MKTVSQFIICFFSILITSVCLAAHVDTVNIPSKVMHKQFKAAVILPDAYKNSSTPFHVVYLLHGGEGCYRDWLLKNI